MYVWSTAGSGTWAGQRDWEWEINERLEVARRREGEVTKLCKAHWEGDLPLKVCGSVILQAALKFHHGDDNVLGMLGG